MHYMEHELREYLGEGHGAAGDPNPDKVQEELQALLKNIEKWYEKLKNLHGTYQDVEAAYIACVEGTKEAQKFLEHQERLTEMEAKATGEVHEGGQPLGPYHPVEADLGQWASEVINLLTPGHQNKS